VTGDIIRGTNGTEFIFMGTKFNAEEIKSTEGIDICWIEEAHNLTEASWDIIDPTIRKPGSELWITFNPRFKFDHIYQLFVQDTPPPDSWVQKVNHDDNPWFPDVLRLQMEHMKQDDYEKYLFVWEGELRQLAEGAIFGKQISRLKKEGRLCSIPIQANCEVHCFFDIGKNDSTAIWFMQQVGNEYRFIDYFEARLEEVEFYTRFIKSRDYLYGTFYLPHDADHDRLGMVRNIRQQFEDGGVRPVEIVPRVQHKATAIELAREKLHQCWFHLGDDARGRRMERGFETLCNYRYKFKADDNVFQLTPHHDSNSNGADAFQQFAQGYHGGSGRWRPDNKLFNPDDFIRHAVR
jgi:phage terminase large subunit